MELDLKEMLRILRRQWWILLLVPLIAAAAGYEVTNQQTRNYETTMTMRIFPTSGEENTMNFNAVVGTQSLVETYRRLIISRPMLAEVIAKLRLPYSVDELRDHVTSSSVQNTQLFQVTVSDPNPETASQIATELSAGFIEQLPQTGLAATVVEAAPVPSVPISPQPVIASLLAGAAGILVAIVLAALREYFDESVTARSDFQTLAGAPLVASIGRIPLFLRRYPLSLPIRESPQSAGAEAIRILRANVEFAMRSRKSRVIMVSSPSSNEGRSTIAANLAFALAEAEISTILVDADFRHPSLQTRFNVGNNPGMAALLVESEITPESTGVTRIERDLGLVPAGAEGQTISAMLKVDRFRAAIDKLSRSADVVIVDTPPFLNRSDAFVIAASVDDAILVCSSGKTKRRAIASTAASLSQNGVRIVGVVLNRPLPGWHPRRWFEVFSRGQGASKNASRANRTPTPMTSVASRATATGPAVTGKQSHG